MQRYAAYIQTLDELLEQAAWGRFPVQKEVMHAHLNGGAAAQLRELVTRTQLRQSGAFFTGESLGRRMVKLIPTAGTRQTPAWDPNSGAGYLLLRWSERLQVVDEDLKETLTHWSEKLHGADIHPEFLQVAKRRLALAAIDRGARLKRGSQLKLDQFFPGLRCRDLLKHDIEVPDSSVILMNPPFTMIQTPEDCEAWASGKVAFAAVAFLHCLKAAKPGQKILAILPDVLRSGTRYERWRKLVSQRASSAQVHIVGRFNEHADVDVFILQATASQTGAAKIKWFQATAPKTKASVLGDLCEVRVGSVVPYRHEHQGDRVPYLTTGSAPPWQELKAVEDDIQHKGSCVTGPFLAVRRTSSPSDSTRAIATVINWDTPTAVENHLISIRPLDGTVKTCRQVRDYLKTDTVRRWLDRRIRCRHLTVGVLKDIPLRSSFHECST